MRAVLAIVVVLLVGAAIAGGVYVQKSQLKQEEAARVAAAGPPADARFIEEGAQPSVVVASIQRKNAPPSHYIGMWVKEPGWDMGIDDVSAASGGGLGLKQYRAEHANALGGGFWLCAVVPAMTDVRKGDHVFISGRIDAVESYNVGEVTPSYRIVLRDAKAINQTKR